MLQRVKGMRCASFSLIASAAKLVVTTTRKPGRAMGAPASYSDSLKSFSSHTLSVTLKTPRVLLLLPSFGCRCSRCSRVSGGCRCGRPSKAVRAPFFMQHTAYRRCARTSKAPSRSLSSLRCGSADAVCCVMYAAFFKLYAVCCVLHSSYSCIQLTA